MNFVDRTLVRLADPAARGPLFDQQSLAQLIDAGYDTSQMTLQGPFNPLFEEVRIGSGVLRTGLIEGSWSAGGGAERTEARFEVAGLSQTPPIRVDAVWRGAIVARTSSPTGRITNVDSEWPSPSHIDAEIIAALGSLPADPVALEQERRNRYRLRLRAVLAQPDTLDDNALDRWLRFAGVTTVGELMANAGSSNRFGAVTVTYTETAAPPPSLRELPVAVAVLVRDAGVSLADLLSESKQVRELLEPSLGRAQNDPTLRQRQAVIVAWLLPQAVFQDSDWPTETNPANPADQLRERRTLAGRWLAREGIGLIVS